MMQRNALMSYCEYAVMINTLITKPTLLLIFAVKISPVVIASGIDVMFAQIVTFRLAVNL